MRIRKGNLKRETEFLLITAQNKNIGTNHIKVMIDKKQQNSKYDDRDETIIHIIKRMQQIRTERVYDYTRLGRQGDLLVIVQ